jgi:hypothetical protein
MNARAIIPLGLIAVLGCNPSGLLYPGDELRENPPGYGLIAIGADATIRLYTLELCAEKSCLAIGPFMQVQEAYLVRLPAGRHCLTQVEAEEAGSITGGGSGLGLQWSSGEENACFRVSEEKLNYLGSFSVVEGRLRVVRRPDMRARLHEHYPGLDESQLK